MSLIKETIFQSPVFQCGLERRNRIPGLCGFLGICFENTRRDGLLQLCEHLLSGLRVTQGGPPSPSHAPSLRVGAGPILLSRPINEALQAFNPPFVDIGLAHALQMIIDVARNNVDVVFGDNFRVHHIILHSRSILKCFDVGALGLAVGKMLRIRCLS